MTDMLSTIVPKSDQLNADDLLGGPRTITVTKVVKHEGKDDQPIDIFFDGDNGKPYKPNKSMRRVLVLVWGSARAAYVGRSMTLFNNKEVSFGPDKTGGIQISHMSHMPEAMTFPLTVSRGRKKPYTVRPLHMNGAKSSASAQPQSDAPPLSEDLIDAGRGAAMNGVTAYTTWLATLTEEQKSSVRAHHNKEWSKVAKSADEAAAARMAQESDPDQIAI